MRFFNSHNEYGLLAKLFHWLTFIVLIAQVPFGFYLVGLEFSDERIELENIHILVGITVFYLTLFRLIWKFFNPSPSETRSFFKGQVFIGKANHFLLYLSIFTITISGILKKLYMGETLNFIFFSIWSKENFKDRGILSSSIKKFDMLIALSSFWFCHMYARYADKDLKIASH